MTKYAVTGASGHLGQLVLADLLSKGVPSEDIVALVRDPAKQSVAGIDSRIADYDKPETVQAALAGVDNLLLISGSEPGGRVAQHKAVIDAAKANGVSRIVYTSAPHATTSALALAPEHKATEELLVASGIDYVILRNSWYTENYTSQLSTYLAHNAIVHAAKDGLVSGAPRKDYAEAAAAALVGDQSNVVLELGGTPFTMDDLAAAITKATGTTVVAKDVSISELVEILKGAGMDEGTASFVASLDEATARNDLLSGTNDLEDLIGRPTTPLLEAVREAVAS